MLHQTQQRSPWHMQHTHTHILNQMREMKEKDKEKYDSKSTLTAVPLG